MNDRPAFGCHHYSLIRWDAKKTFAHLTHSDRLAEQPDARRHQGMSEGGVMGAIGALCDAVGIRVEQQPLTPFEIVRLLSEGPDAGAAATAMDRSRQ
jgi:hypothetical protein